MNHPDSDRDQFLRELFESEHGGCETTAEQVSRLVRREREKRQQRVTMVVAFIAIFAFATIHFRTSKTPQFAGVPNPLPPPETISEPGMKPASFTVEQVDDEGLLEMLKDQPVALASLPNGERRLMMIVRQVPGH